MRHLLTLGLLAVAACHGGDGGDGGDGGTFTITNPGSGAPNAAPLDPLPIGARFGDSGLIVDGLVRMGDTTVKRVLAGASNGDSAIELWITETADGQFLYGDTADGVLPNPVLLVPASVKVGMTWDVPEGEDVESFTFSVASAETRLTPYGTQTVWTILQTEGDAAHPIVEPLVTTRTYVEGYGELAIMGFSGQDFSSAVIPLDAAPAAPAAPTLVTPTALGDSGLVGPVAFASVLDHGDGTLSLQVATLAVGEANGLLVPARADACLAYRAGAVTPGCSDIAPTVIDVSGALYVGGVAMGVARDGNGNVFEAGDGNQTIHYFDYLDGSGAPHDVTSSLHDPQLYIDGAGALPVRGAPNFELARDAQLTAFPGWTYLTARTPDAHGILPVAIVGSNGMVLFSRFHVHADGTVSHFDTPALAFEIDPTATRTIRTSATEQEMLIARLDGEIERIVVTSDGVALDELAHVAVPAGSSLHGAVRLTPDGTSHADDPLLLFIYGAPDLEIPPFGPDPTEAPTSLYRLDHVTHTPVTPLPAAAITSVKLGPDAEICWPASAGSGAGSGWQLGGLPVVAAVPATADGSCVVLVRDPSLLASAIPTNQTQPVDAWHVEGSIPGIGRVAMAIGSAPVVAEQAGFPLRGGGFLASQAQIDDGVVIYDAGGVPIDAPDDPILTAFATRTIGGGLWGAIRNTSELCFFTPAAACTTSPIACSVTACVPAVTGEQQGGMALTAAYGSGALLLGADGSAVAIAPPPQDVQITGTSPTDVAGALYMRLTDGTWCGAASAGHAYLWCQSPAGAVRTLDVSAALGVSSPSLGELHALTDGTFVVPIVQQGTYVFDAAAFTLTKIDPRYVTGISAATDGSLWGISHAGTTTSLVKVTPSGLVDVPDSATVGGFSVGDTLIIASVSDAGGVTQRLYPRP